MQKYKQWNSRIQIYELKFEFGLHILVYEKIRVQYDKWHKGPSVHTDL